MALKFYARQSFYINHLTYPIKEQIVLVSQNLAKRFNSGINKAIIFFNISTSLFISLFTKNFFTKFMKVFIKLI